MRIVAMEQKIELPDCVPLPLSTILERVKLGDAAIGAGETLRDVVLPSRVLQDFRRLPQCLEWELSDLYWSSAGLLPFAENDVPYAINNNSRLSENAAALLYANCQEIPPTGPLLLFECGAGTGLFARYLLDAFRALCRESGADFYDRLTFLVTDSSPTTLRQWIERGIFSEHQEHVVLATCDALRPGEARTVNGDRVAIRDLRAVFANYLLDTLPSTVIRNGEHGCEELHIRTHLTEAADRVATYTRMTLDEMRALASSPDVTEKAKLIPLVTLFEYESAFIANGSAPPHAQEALDFNAGLDRSALNYGAIEFLEMYLGFLDAGGFILVNDYGPSEREQVVAQSSPQKFGSTVAFGLNFPFLDHYFATRDRVMIKAEEDKEALILVRLLMNSRLAKTIEVFDKRFTSAAFREVENPATEARKHVEAGRFDEAKELYQKGLERSPRDWRLIAEIAEFVIRQASDYRAGLELARAAITINPWYSAWLWNVLGDALFALGRYDEAFEAYLQARRIDSKDPRTSLNLAYSYAQAGAYADALNAIASGLATDMQGFWRNRLIEKQQLILAAISAKSSNEQEWLNRRNARLR
jgi:tetratricopeptide (TPR) repeat protein